MCVLMHIFDLFYSYTVKMDKMIQEAFRLNVKWSLQELSRAINGDGKSAPNPLFKVNVVLEGMAVEFSPTLKQLASIVGSIHGYLTETLKDIKRLPEIMSRKKQAGKEVTRHDVRLFSVIFVFPHLFKNLYRLLCIKIQRNTYINLFLADCLIS